jgi:hypothetical protein
MPVHVKVLHPQKLVLVVIEGPVVLKDMEDHFDKIVLENAIGYAKLVDCSRAQPVYNDNDVLMMGARLSAYTKAMGEAGPLAVFGESDELNLAFARFINMSPSKRPAGLFKTEGQARARLARQALPSAQRTEC